ncbi:MAG: repeat containing protein, partial [Verrucomicrobiales bacterium]|nr:repeat containing protein [Verrucomicrobiales bacterium]
MQNEKIFPHRWTRRDFLKVSGMAAASLAVPSFSLAKETNPPIRIGSGHHTYELVEGWGKLPNGEPYGLGCGIAVDGKDRIYVLTRTKPGLAIFDRAGKLVELWQEEEAVKKGLANDTFTATAHGLYWSKENGKEYLYFTENKAKTGTSGRLVTKTDLKGNVLLRIGNVTEESKTAIKFTFDNPTDVAIAANGDIYVVDGYGSQLVHRFDKNGKLIKTIGGRTEKAAVGPNAPHGTFNTCHGVWISTLNKTPEIYIADRNNKRVEIYSMDLEYRRTLKDDVRNPCCFYQHKECLYIPDLD